MACYVINKSRFATLDGKVTDEVWIGNEVDHSGLRIFGCPTYVSSDQRSMLDPKSRKCIFLGYVKAVKGYKFWGPEANKIVLCLKSLQMKRSPVQARAAARAK